ncbi:acetoin dehydrogenase dihydrolipoyllysine-residue acetyltransferase subunit [Burkholderia sp. SRS-W-2-2016]|uniref:acetoin dehydrogenase dihydrolipoyllysine-residue acetyltransferase subunit n=1 Tax=Burkholderia sp. SRS-W-2-2016 TaxID=1926878 RepID=UPI00094AD0D5|nr:acetoin dehydrogenase dihydrolipoyllysine-residue acetyltransferase subunit [Burkholderia sp. SRS-W-2-2016]OLL31096.1 acetoin dehydrogenase dihydrolipoyllysine-residue acetyltransferase subunit [Burkholderia sp. SRS-W-2-2016]
MSTYITPIVMPKWGLEMREGTVQDWLVAEGERIEVGQPLLDVDTDKISNAVEATDAGLLRRIVAQSGDTLPVKALLGVLADSEVSDAEIEAYIAAYEVPAAGDDEEESGPAFDYADVGGIRVRYARRGPDQGTPVLFIHGFGGDLNNWLFNLDAIAAKHPVIALDLPAHGQSQAALPGASVDALADFVRGFLEAAHVNGPVHVVGHSMGGAIAMQMALSTPAQVASLALVSPAGFDSEINSGYTDGFVQAQSRRELKPVLEQLFADPELVSRQMIDDLLKFKRMDGIEPLLAELAGTLFRDGRQSAILADRLAGVDKPVLVLWGKDDRVIPSAQAAKAPAGAQVILFDATGHMAMLEKASEVNAALLRHLAGG